MMYQIGMGEHPKVSLDTGSRLVVRELVRDTVDNAQPTLFVRVLIVG